MTANERFGLIDLACRLRGLSDVLHSSPLPDAPTWPRLKGRADECTVLAARIALIADEMIRREASA